VREEHPSPRFCVEVVRRKTSILPEMGRFDDAKKAYDEAVKIISGDANLSQEVKDNTALFHHYNLARVAVGKKDLAAAKTETETFRKGAEAAKNRNQIKQARTSLPA
jgi:hypothetical protein